MNAFEIEIRNFLFGVRARLISRNQRDANADENDGWSVVRGLGESKESTQLVDKAWSGGREVGAV